MSRLPIPGGDDGIWGQVLNDFLSVSHANDGTLNEDTVGSGQIQDNSIADQHVSSLSQGKISDLQSDLNGVVTKNSWMIARAGSFIRTMMQSITTVTTPSTISLNYTYDPTYTGSVSGTFNLLGVNPGTEQLCPVNVQTPVGDIPDSYFGTVTGNIANYSQLPSDTYTVQAYKTTDSDYSQPSSATVDDSGNFSLDLSTTPNWIQGTWKFGLLSSSNTLVGQKWPQDVSYVNLVVNQYVVTDQSYLIGSQPASSEGTFAFLSTQTGMKQVQLVNTVSNAVVAEYVPPIQNIRSYLVASGEPGYGTNFVNYCYTYDQSIALLAAIASGDQLTAKKLVAGLLQLQSGTGASTGAFTFSAPQLSPAYGNGYFRTGAHAFALYAILSYMEANPNDSTQDYQTAVTNGFTYVASLLSNSGTTNGLYLGGTGLYVDPVGQPEQFNEGYNIDWASTEHNLDVWHAFNKAATVLGDSTYTTLANNLQDVILTSLWDSTNQRLLQGMDPTGPDDSDPLDMHTWGAIWLNAVGRSDLANIVMSSAALAPFQLTSNGVTGYAAAYSAGGYPGIVPSVWSEGTFGAALAFLALGDTVNWQATIDGIAGGQEADGSFRYVTVADTTYEFTSSKSTIGAAWSILAALGHGIWDITIPR